MRVWSRSGTSMIGKPERFGVATPRPCSVSRIRAVMAWRWPRRASPRRSLTSKPARTVASEATGDGPEYRYGGGAGGGARGQVRRGRDLQQVLDLGRAGDERQQRRVGLREAADEHDVVVGLARVAHDAVAARSEGARLVRGALADDAEPVRIVDVQEGTVLARDRREGGKIRRVAGHAVDAV